MNGQLERSQGETPELVVYRANRRKLVAAGHLHWFHWAVIVFSLLLTLVAWYITKEQVREKVEERFSREADRTVELVKERMGVYENALWGSVGLINANQGLMNYTQWKTYAESLQVDKTYPGINGIGIIYNIEKRNLDPFLEQQRKTRPEFSLHPEHANSELWPITFIEPLNINKKAEGLDIAFEKNRYESVVKARETGMAQVTGPITLVQDAKKTPGFLFYAPFYKNGLKPETIVLRNQNIIGVTYAPFIMYKLMEGTLARGNRHVSISIKDGGESLYDESDDQKFEDTLDQNPLYQKAFTVPMYGREWYFEISSDLSFRVASSNSQPIMILVAGIVIDSMLLGLFLLLTRANRRALSYADEMVDELNQQTVRLKKSNEDLEQFSYIASHDLKSPLNAISQISQWLTEDCKNLIPKESQMHLTLLQARSARMMQLLNDLLDYSRVSQYDYTIEEINLNTLVNDIFELHGQPEKVELSVTDANIYIPRVPLEIVLRNLISNAIKHHDKEEGKIWVTYDKEGTNHKIVVRDNGPGIPEEMLEKVMELFQTLQSRDKVEGSGMGLAIARKIVEYYCGRIWATSDGVSETSFTIIWPATN